MCLDEIQRADVNNQDDYPATRASELTSPLLRLPAELRNRIYSFAVVAEQRLEVLPKHGSSHLNKQLVQPALSQVSAQLRCEVLPIFYGENSFQLKLTHGSHRAPLELLFVWLRSIGKNNCDLIRNLHACLPKASQPPSVQQQYSLQTTDSSQVSFSRLFNVVQYQLWLRSRDSFLAGIKLDDLQTSADRGSHLANSSCQHQRFVLSTKEVAPVHRPHCINTSVKAAQLEQRSGMSWRVGADVTPSKNHNSQPTQQLNKLQNIHDCLFGRGQDAESAAREQRELMISLREQTEEVDRNLRARLRFRALPAGPTSAASRASTARPISVAGVGHRKSIPTTFCLVPTKSYHSRATREEMVRQAVLVVRDRLLAEQADTCVLQ